ncbi:MAG: hypothetical protein ACYTFZ_10110 [Planctomycetota bacterium]|jgi:hypothetical protein
MRRLKAGGRIAIMLALALLMACAGGQLREFNQTKVDAYQGHAGFGILYKSGWGAFEDQHRWGKVNDQAWQHGIELATIYGAAYHRSLGASVTYVQSGGEDLAALDRATEELAMAASEMLLFVSAWSLDNTGADIGSYGGTAQILIHVTRLALRYGIPGVLEFIRHMHVVDPGVEDFEALHALVVPPTG